MFGFLEYFFKLFYCCFAYKIKSRRRLLKTMAISLNTVVKKALIWLVLGGFFCVFSQSETICNLHSCYRFALLLQKNSTPFSVNQNWVIFSCILLTKSTDYTPDLPHLDYRRVPHLVRKFKGNLLKQYQEYWSKNLNKDKFDFSVGNKLSLV